jgi:methionine aminopeptidase
MLPNRRQVKPGTMYRDLGKTIEKTASKTGLSVVRTYCGHGIGTLFHTAPNVPHYAKNKAKVSVGGGGGISLVFAVAYKCLSVGTRKNVLCTTS